MPALGQGTRLWPQSRYEDFDKGTPESVAIDSPGVLTPGPVLKPIAMTPSTYIWSAASAADNAVYLATGSPATVLHVTADGKTERVFTSKDLGVQVVRTGPDGALYAATLPSGKVYRLKQNDRNQDETGATVVFDPASVPARPKYVWDMQFDAKGRLYLATGGPAGIYRVNPARPGDRPELFFQSDEVHVRALAFDRSGNLIAGTDGSGLVYRISPEGKGFVLYNAPRREITALALGPDGTIYASAVGEKGHSSLPPLPVQGTPNVTATITIVQPGSVQAFNGNTVIPDGSEVYELPAEGAPRRLWSGRDDIVYALHWTPGGLLAATGNRGRIYQIREDGTYADVAHLEAGQAAAIAPGPGGLYVATSNTGRLYTLSSKPAVSGTYTSRVYDAGAVSQWGQAETEPANSGELYVRVGNVDNPARGWSDWKQVKPGAGVLGLEPARFIQWKAVLNTGSRLTSVGINYLPVNSAPVVDEVMVASGARVNPAAAVPPPSAANLVLNFPSAQSNAINFVPDANHEPLQAVRDRSSITVRWAAHDDNGDELSFSVYYRGEDEANWQLLKDRLNERWYSFDAALLPDGPYRIRVVASDAPSHNPGEALTGARVSDRFVVDTAPPVVTMLTTQKTAGGLHIVFSAADSASPIAHAEYSVDAGPWQYIEPVGRLSDARSEHYDFTADLTRAALLAADGNDNPLPPANPSEHVVAVRIYDRFENVGTGKAVAR